MHRQALYRFVSAHLLVLSLLLGLGQVSVARAAGVAGTVDSHAGLNLRAGPGLVHRVLLVLNDGQTLELVGRSQSSQWLEVRLPESGLAGWVFAAYVETSAEINALPVTEGAGGPLDGRPPAAQAYSLYVAIADNQATVYLQRYPSRADLVLKLGRAGGTADLVVAQGKTDANGLAQLTFPMPARWPDGQRVMERNLVLAAGTADGAFSQSVSVLYIR